MARPVSALAPAPGLFGQLANTYNAKVRGAQITVRCDCGGIGYVPYGERWECRTCHRRWNTGQIPAEEYWGIMRDMRRMRISAIVTALAVVVPIVALASRRRNPDHAAASGRDELLVPLLHAQMAAAGQGAGEKPAQVEAAPGVT